jgi:thiamine-phosphate pyrophosphorylase
MIFYAVSDRRVAPCGDLIQQASGLIRGGVDWLQIREKDLPDRAVFGILKMLAPEARRFGVRLLVNGRPDLAAAAGASGVHLPSAGLPTREVRRSFPSPFVIVRSCHSLREAAQAGEEGADAVVIGPVFDTPSKAGMGQPFGLAALADACGRCAIPVLGIGGIDAGRIREVASTGAAGVAAIRLFFGMRAPILEIPELRAASGNTFDRQGVST